MRMKKVFVYVRPFGEWWNVLRQAGSSAAHLMGRIWPENASSFLLQYFDLTTCV
jgi:hypothetical protein